MELTDSRGKEGPPLYLLFLLGALVLLKNPHDLCFLKPWL